MGRLDNYSVYSRNKGGKIFISVTAYGITFSKASIESLDYPEYVQVLFDENGRNMAIKPCNKDSEARLFVKDRNSKRAGFVRWNDKKLIKYMTELAELKIGSKGIRIKGEYFSDENILIYNLNTYTQIERGEK